jgi:hypothetical protein
MKQPNDRTPHVRLFPSLIGVALLSGMGQAQALAETTSEKQPPAQSRFDLSPSTVLALSDPLPPSFLMAVPPPSEPSEVPLEAGVIPAVPASDPPPLSVTLTMGPSDLHAPAVSDPAMSYGVRLGYRLLQKLSLELGMEGTRASTGGAGTSPYPLPSQNLYTLGLQYRLLPTLYLRCAVGTGMMNAPSALPGSADAQGAAFVGGLGFEIVHGRHAAIGLEADASDTRYARDSWQTGELGLVLAMF